jgi:L-ascorbate metabolism protein UlaG (beta-lactamase superfamily)
MIGRLAVPTLALVLAFGAGAGLAADEAVTLRYYGQSFFVLTTPRGTRIALDPYGQIGYPLPSGVIANAVFITHEHGDHNNAGLIQGTPKVFRGLIPGGWATIRERVGDALVYSVPSFHDAQGGTSPRGFNSLLVIETGGLRIAHLGDLGQPVLTDGQLKALGRIDVLIIPVGGGPFTINGEQASRITDMIRPRVVIPMHYKTAARPTWPGTDEQPFLVGKTQVDRPGHTTSFTRGALPGSLQTVVMNWQ